MTNIKVPAEGDIFKVPPKEEIVVEEAMSRPTDGTPVKTHCARLLPTKKGFRFATVADQYSSSPGSHNKKTPGIVTFLIPTEVCGKRAQVAWNHQNIREKFSICLDPFYEPVGV
jgi:hypothetical protein